MRQLYNCIYRGWKEEEQQTPKKAERIGTTFLLLLRFLVNLRAKGFSSSLELSNACPLMGMLDWPFPLSVVIVAAAGELPLFGPIPAKQNLAMHYQYYQ